MTDVIVAKFPRKQPKSRRSVVEGKGRDALGQWVQTYTIDAHSGSFGDDLTYVFSKNIAKARRENRQKFGSADGIRKK